MRPIRRALAALRRVPRPLLALAAILLLAACAVSPTGRRQFMLMPEGEMAAMGAQAFEDIQRESPPAADRRTSDYVRCIGDALTALDEVRETHDEWEIVVFDDDQVNAFALPGGKIGVYRGLLGVAETPDQLAAVMGHEVGHVLARHGNERVSQQFAVGESLGLVDAWLAAENSGRRTAAMALLGLGAEVGILLPFSRTHEREADVIGLDLMARAGFDPRASVTLWENMARAGGDGPPEFLSTHPSHDTRIGDLRAGMDEALTLYDEAMAQGRRPNCTPPA